MKFPMNVDKVAEIFKETKAMWRFRRSEQIVRVHGLFNHEKYGLGAVMELAKNGSLADG